MDNTTVFILKNEDGVPGARPVTEHELSTLPPSAFLSKDEIVEHLAQTLSAADKNDLLSFDVDELAVLHFSAGRQIRNAYAMWVDNNPHVNYKDSMAENFPDQLSQSVIVALHARLNKQLGSAQAFDDSKQALFDLD